MTNKFPAMSLAEAHALLTRHGSPFEIEERDIRGVRTRVWKNAPPTMRDLFRLARSHGNKTFVVYRDERVSYEEFARAALAIADALQRAGVKKGDRVAIAMRNLPDGRRLSLVVCSPAALRFCSMPGGPARNCNTASTIPAPRSLSSIMSGSSGYSSICRIVRRWSGCSSAARPKTLRIRKSPSSKASSER
jgi:non-ribosomal peptide synthetase component F